MSKITVLLVDDHSLVRAGFRRILDESDEFKVIGEAGDCPGAIAAAAQLHPQLILMDISIPGGSGIEAIKLIREAEPESRFVMLSQYDRPHYVQEALRAGASGYLLKTASAEDLVEALHTALEGSVRLSPEVATRIVEGFAEAESRARLTSREAEVLRLVAEGLSSKQIAAALDISPRTAETHRANLMSKLGFGSVADLVRFAIREGFVAL